MNIAEMLSLALLSCFLFCSPLFFLGSNIGVLMFCRLQQP